MNSKVKSVFHVVLDVHVAIIYRFHRKGLHVVRLSKKWRHRRLIQKYFRLFDLKSRIDIIGMSDFSGFFMVNIFLHINSYTYEL